MCRAEGPRGLQEGPLLPRGAVPGGTRRNRAGALSPTAAQGCSPGRGGGGWCRCRPLAHGCFRFPGIPSTQGPGGQRPEPGTQSPVAMCQSASGLTLAK